MINIEMLDGSNITWESKDYTEYKVIDNLFVVIKDEQQVGFYNLGAIKGITVSDTEE